MASKHSRVENGKEFAAEEDIPDNVVAYLVKLMDQIQNMKKDMRGLMDKLMLVEEVAKVNSHNNEIELHALLSHAAGVSHVIIKDDEDVASILQDERAIVVFVTVKARNVNDISHEHVGSLSFTNDTVMVMSDDDASDQIEYDVEEEGMADWNDELHDDCEDDYTGKHDDCIEDDKGEYNDILDCNHTDGSIGHATTVVSKEVQCDNHAITIEVEDVEGVDPIYDNLIALENGIRSLDDNDQ
ncbi:uncharacterized protein LOC110412367 [Herrania umbratica]|uniref:Uncharacterized protein LOC110412367 n=1 Tax=Herrania umbratica TaxID=108875 RepID=A0A6J0ZV12_9ROSI|nr:uncharacterized protein LOC110412367 [Herrania umbratica]